MVVVTEGADWGTVRRMVGGRTVIFDREIHVAEGAPMKSMSIEKLRTV